MSSIFVKLESDNKSFYCTWDSKEGRLQIQSSGKTLQEFTNLDFDEAFKKIKKFKKSIEP